MFNLTQALMTAIDSPNSHSLMSIVTAAQGQSVELIGLVLTDGTIVHSRNTHDTPGFCARLDPALLIKYPRLQIAAIWHTHWADTDPGEFTITDLNMAHGRDRFPIVLWHSGFKCWDYYEPQNPNPFPLRFPEFDPFDVQSYVGWAFSWGRMDCFALIRRALLGLYGRDIGEWPRPDVEGFPFPGWVCPWDRAGLVEVEDAPQKYDLLEIALGGGRNPNHLALLTNPGTNGTPRMLHNPGYLNKSVIEPYSRAWRSRTVRRLRIV